MNFRGIVRIGCLVSMAIVLAACESTDREARKAERAQREAESARLRAELLSRIHEAESEVWQILNPLMQSAAGYRVEETHGYIGAVFVTEAYYSEALVKEARAEGFGSHVSVLLVFPDSPAEFSGMQGGDKLLSVNGVNVPKGQNAAIFASRRIKRLLEPGKTNVLEVERDGERIRLEIESEEGAYYGLVIDASNTIDLHVDGDFIWLGHSIIESLEQSEELPYLCAYALAKNVMRHSKQKGKNAFLGQLLDVAAMAGGVNTGGVFGSMGGAAHAHAFEVESDLIALYLLASSGYKIDTYPDYWEKVLRHQSRKGELKTRQLERLEKMRSVIEAIQTKQAEGQPLFPEEYLQGDTSELE